MWANEQEVQSHPQQLHELKSPEIHKTLSNTYVNVCMYVCMRVFRTTEKYLNIEFCVNLSSHITELKKKKLLSHCDQPLVGSTISSPYLCSPTSVEPITSNIC